MKIKWVQEGGIVVCELLLEDGDVTSAEKIVGINTPSGVAKCYFKAPSGFNLGDVHPDLVAVAGALIVAPFVKERIVVEQGISDVLADLFREKIGLVIRPVNSQAVKRNPPDDSVPALMFSGGVDSTAASIVMPQDTIHFFVNRDSKAKANIGLYDKSAAVYACDQLRKLSKKVVKVDTDYEFIRSPVGFAEDISSAVPAVLFADHYGLDSLAFGMVLESAYSIDRSFSPYRSRWRAILEHIGLNFNLVTAGISEVGTLKIVNSNADYKHFAQSCVRGKVGEPCMQCFKCFRKNIVGSALKGGFDHDGNLVNMIKLPGFYSQIIKYPAHHENVFAFAMNHYTGAEAHMEKFAKKVRANKIPSSWTERWYNESSSTDLIHPKYRDEVTNSIRRYLDDMTQEDKHFLEAWNIRNLSIFKRVMHKRYHRQFVECVDNLRK